MFCCWCIISTIVNSHACASRMFYFFLSCVLFLLSCIPFVYYNPSFFALVYSYIFPRVSILFCDAYTPFLFLSYIRCFAAGA